METQYFPESFSGFEIHPRVYSLVPVRRERLLTLRHQQQRACNLADWIVHHGAPARLAVIGGGLAGLTCAAAYKRQTGAAVSVFERNAEELSNLRTSVTRWVHPHFFSWPQRGWDMRRTFLPVLNWSAGTAQEVYQTLHAEWRRHKIPTITHCRVQRLESRGGEIRLTMDVQGEGVRTEPFDAVVVAIGPGHEQVQSGSHTGSYWEADQLISSSETVRHFVVAGAGDGALTDLLRLRLRPFFDHSNIVDLANAILAQREVFAKIMDGRKPTQRQREQIRWFFDDHGLRRDTKVTMVASREDADRLPNAFPINQLLVRSLRAIDAFEVRYGRVVGAANWIHKDRVAQLHREHDIVYLEGDTALRAHGFVARVGITPPALIDGDAFRGRALTEIEEAIHVVQQTAWSAADETMKMTSAERAVPAVERRPCAVAGKGRIDAQWAAPDALVVGGSRIQFDGVVVQIGAERFTSVLLAATGPDETLVGVLPTLSGPDTPGAFSFARLYAAGARLFAVGAIEDGQRTLDAWKAAGAGFQVVHPTPTDDEFQAEQPWTVGESWTEELRILADT